MKKGLLLIVVICISLASFAQADTTTPPFKKFPVLPPVQLLLSDSTTKFSKDNLQQNKQTLFIIFSPDCSHCQHETEELVARKEEMKDIQIVLITLHPLWMMNEFIAKYKLNELPNVTVGKDIYYLTPSFYGIHNLPFLAMYNKKGNLISAFEGSMEMDKVITLFKENK